MENTKPLLNKFDRLVVENMEKSNGHLFCDEKSYGIKYKNFLGCDTSLVHEISPEGDVISYDFTTEQGKKRHYTFKDGDGNVFPFNELTVASERAEWGFFE